MAPQSGVGMVDLVARRSQCPGSPRWPRGACRNRQKSGPGRVRSLAPPAASPTAADRITALPGPRPGPPEAPRAGQAASQTDPPRHQEGYRAVRRGSYPPVQRPEVLQQQEGYGTSPGVHEDRSCQRCAQSQRGQPAARSQGSQSWPAAIEDQHGQACQPAPGDPAGRRDLRASTGVAPPRRPAPAASPRLRRRRSARVDAGIAVGGGPVRWRRPEGQGQRRYGQQDCHGSRARTPRSSRGRWHSTSTAPTKATSIP